MSRQFRFYLLPSDIERLAAELRSRFGAKFIDSVSPSMKPAEIDSCLRKSEYNRSTDVYCYFIPPTGAEIKMWYMPKRELWAIEESSEVIQFSGCNFDGEVLQSGRFYFQTDVLIADAIWLKRREFLEWADAIFRTTKRLLRYSKAIDAYLGEDATHWRRNGGKFASSIGPGGKFIVEQGEV
jgi:hypothetical protein